MALSTAELITQVETAITACLEGKSASYNGRTYTSENLSELRAFRSELLRRQSVENNPNKSRNRAKVRFT